MWRPFWKWRPVDIFRCQESFRDIIIYLHMKCRWNWTMLNLCGIVAAILKMATVRNFSMSGHHYLPKYQILMILDNVEFLRQPFWKWRPVEIFQCWESIRESLSTHISNFDDIGQCWIFTAHFLYRVLAAILKMADISKILNKQYCSFDGDLSLCQILCLYHYSFSSYQH